MSVDSMHETFDPVTRKQYTGVAQKMSGDRAWNPPEKAARDYNLRNIREGKATGWQRTMYGVGRLMRAANFAAWIYGTAKLGGGAFQAVAQVGSMARLQPHSGLGSGIEDNYMAATMRQAALSDMYHSEYANRRHMGNEARFLHT
jgi:hypothetical protein